MKTTRRALDLIKDPGYHSRAVCTSPDVFFPVLSGYAGGERRGHSERRTQVINLLTTTMLPLLRVCYKGLLRVQAVSL